MIAHVTCPSKCPRASHVDVYTPTRRYAHPYALRALTCTHQFVLPLPSPPGSDQSRHVMYHHLEVFFAVVFCAGHSLAGAQSRDPQEAPTRIRDIFWRRWEPCCCGQGARARRPYLHPFTSLSSSLLLCCFCGRMQSQGGVGKGVGLFSCCGQRDSVTGH